MKIALIDTCAKSIKGSGTIPNSNVAAVVAHNDQLRVGEIATEGSARIGRRSLICGP